MKHTYTLVVILSVTLSLTVASGLYSAHLSKSEMLHFWVFFPQRGNRPITTIDIDVNNQGILKRILNPWIIALSTHWIVNTGNKPYSIRLELINCTIPVEWEVSAGIPWNSSTKSFGQPIGPGQSVPYLGLDWFFHVPPEVRSQRIWYHGGLAIIDANSDEILSFIPISICRG